MATKKTGAPKKAETDSNTITDSKGNEYSCSIPKFNFNRTLYTGEELCKKPKLVDDLVAAGFAGLTLTKEAEVEVEVPVVDTANPEA